MNRRLILTGWLLLVVAPFAAQAHCDGLDGPVVQAARTALDRGDVRPALAWVRAADEAEVRRAFDDTLAVRKLGAQAKELADRHFFETLVRVHRQGENAPYTGLKPAGRDLGPAIPAADRAVAERSAEPLIELLLRDVEAGVRERFARVMEAAKEKDQSLDAARSFVAAYVEFLHYVEAVHGIGSAHAESGAHEH